ncbi:MAG: hypothetical protein MJZ70_08325 [Bacteroidales bacterium]|nr:hypothetical protein [Bacteroidales bacterium]
MHSLLDYDPKILLAWGEALKGDRRFTDFLMNNGFPELAALARAILSDTDALQWLMENGYPEFSILSDAIDDEDEAIEWLEKAHCDFLSKFAAACRKDDAAIKWFVDNELHGFIPFIRTIHDILLFQSWDSSDILLRLMS